MANSKACTPDNVVGMLNAYAHTRKGAEIDIDALEVLDSGGVATFYDAISRHAGEEYQSGPIDARSREEVLLARQFIPAPKDVLFAAKGILMEARNPSGLFGEEPIQVVSNFITQHYSSNRNNLSEARNTYKKGIKQALEEAEALIDPGILAAKQASWEKYKKFYTDGGELYNFEPKTMLGKGISNLTGNIIKSSPTVIVGNVLEGTIKLPTLYPKTFLPAIAQVVSEGNLFRKIPELDAAGGYGVNHAGESHDAWGGLIGLTDVPLKNFAYTAGLIEGGPDAALKAVQKVSFTTRFGDLPLMYQNPGGREAVKFLGYTINTYKMYVELWKKASKGDIAPLLTYHALSAAIGGATASMPFGVLGEETIKTLFPDTEQFFEENRNALTSLVQPGAITRVGIGYDIASKKAAKSVDKVQEGIEKIQDGDPTNGILDLAEAGLLAASFSNTVIGDINIQKLITTGRDVAQGEILWEEAPGEIAPFLKQE